MAERATDHDEAVRRLRAIASKVDLGVAAAAFVASLGSAPLRFRTPLAHLAYATNFPDHPFVPSPGMQDYLCVVCGASERETYDPDEHAQALAQGDSVVANPVRALLDLEDFATLAAPGPTVEDVARLDAMLEVLADLPPAGRATDLVKKWGPIVPRSNAYSRAFLVETLGVAGVLETPDHPGHLTRWVGFWEYQEVPSTTGDMRPPEAWWRREHGVRRATLDVLFPQPGLGRARFPEGRFARAIEPGPSRIPGKQKQKARALAVGDVLGVERNGRWVAGVVVGRHGDALPVVEFYRGSFEARPDVQALRGAKARVVGPYRQEPRWRREPLALEGLELFGTTWPEPLELLGRGQDPPGSGGAPLADPAYRVVAPRNLLYLLCTLQSASAVAPT